MRYTFSALWTGQILYLLLPPIYIFNPSSFCQPFFFRSQPHFYQHLHSSAIILYHHRDPTTLPSLPSRTSFPRHALARPHWRDSFLHGYCCQNATHQLPFISLHPSPSPTSPLQPDAQPDRRPDLLCQDVIATTMTRPNRNRLSKPLHFQPNPHRLNHYAPCRSLPTAARRQFDPCHRLRRCRSPPHVPAPTSTDPVLHIAYGLVWPRCLHLTIEASPIPPENPHLLPYPKSLPTKLVCDSLAAACSTCAVVV